MATTNGQQKIFHKSALKRERERERDIAELVKKQRSFGFELNQGFLLLRRRPCGCVWFLAEGVRE